MGFVMTNYLSIGLLGGARQLLSGVPLGASGS
jgi:hypothetical protein